MSKKASSACKEYNRVLTPPYSKSEKERIARMREFQRRKQKEMLYNCKPGIE
jgi:hypothetical protein